MIVNDVHQYTAVFVELFAEPVFAGQIHRVRVGKRVYFAVQHNAADNPGRQSAKIIAVHGIGNKIANDKFRVPERKIAMGKVIQGIRR